MSSLMQKTFRALRHRNYRLYFFGQMVSLTGTWMQTTAMAWMAYEITHKASWPAYVLTAQSLPCSLLGPWGGSLADRHSRRSVIWWTQFGFLVQASLLAALVTWSKVAPWQLLALNVLSGVVLSVDLPARLAFLAELTGRDDLPNAVGLNSMIFNVARILGPAVSGWCLVELGAAVCFATNALSYAAVLWALSRMTDEQLHVAKPAKGQGLWHGFHLLAVDRGLVCLVCFMGVIAIGGWSSISLLPALAQRELGFDARGYSMLLSAMGGGALLGAWLVAARGNERRGVRFIVLGQVGTILGLLILAVAWGAAPAFVGSALLGFGLVLFQGSCQATFQLRLDPDHRGAVLGVWAMVVSGGVPIGNLTFGYSADLVPLGWVLSVEAALCLLGGIGFFLFWPGSRPKVAASA